MSRAIQSTQLSAKEARRHARQSGLNAAATAAGTSAMNAQKAWPSGPNERKSSSAVSDVPSQASRPDPGLLVG